MAELRIGTSGFAYPAWRGAYYPPGLPDREMLAHYATDFSTVEINSTFYRLPSERILADWAGRVPASFRFALKLSQKLTHVQRLRDCEPLLERFLGALSPLTSRQQLGPILVQLPPTFRADAARLDAFFHLAPPIFRLALEVRHPSWYSEEVYQVLRRHRVALCLAEDDEAATPAVVTADFVYARLRREAYPDEALAAWRRRFDVWVVGGLDVYAYVKHDEAGQAPAYARTLLGGP